MPPNVRRWDVLRAMSYTHTSSSPAAMLTAMRVPSGETRGPSTYRAGGINTGFEPPRRSIQTIGCSGSDGTAAYTIEPVRAMSN
jgi:hypothetical protein